MVKRNGEYFRGKIIEVSENDDRVTVLLVDVPEIVDEKCSAENLFEMFHDLFEIPCAIISVKLRAKRQSSEYDEKRIKTLVRLLFVEKLMTGEKMYTAKLYEFKKYNKSIVEIFDPETNKKLA